WKIGNIPTFIGIAVRGRKGILYSTDKHFFFTVSSTIMRIFLIFVIVMGMSPGIYIFAIYPNETVLSMILFILIFGMMMFFIIDLVSVRTIIFDKKEKWEINRRKRIIDLKGNFLSGVSGFNAKGRLSFKILERIGE
ncbi:MAG: hypothetical protein QXP04_04950, partial [Candidatus Nanoarchaeia archaeon]|nr:hypothetical protein [Candidatus Jingweiarchaeum tengchongense]